MRRILFTWNYPEDAAGKLRYLCMRQGITWRAVLPSEDTLPLRRLKADAPASEAEDGAHAFAVPVMLFAGFTMRDMDRFSAAYKESGLPRVALRAMMTPTNSMWTVLQLYQELQKEHASLTGEQIP